MHNTNLEILIKEISEFIKILRFVWIFKNRKQLWDSQHILRFLNNCMDNLRILEWSHETEIDKSD